MPLNYSVVIVCDLQYLHAVFTRDLTGGAFA
jgi:hypothetical protein